MNKIEELIDLLNKAQELHEQLPSTISSGSRYEPFYKIIMEEKVRLRDLLEEHYEISEWLNQSEEIESVFPQIGSKWVSKTGRAVTVVETGGKHIPAGSILWVYTLDEHGDKEKWNLGLFYTSCREVK